MPKEGSNVPDQDIYEELLNVLKIGPIIESEKLSVHDLLVEPTIEPWLNR